MSRDELFAAFEQAGQGTKAQRGYHLLFLLCLQGTLVQGPINTEAGNGNSQFFVSAEAWIKNPRTLEREQALAELALRYFRSHGPATIKDFQWWTKLTLKDINDGPGPGQGPAGHSGVRRRQLLAGARKRRSCSAARFPGARSVLLLPGFDEYLLGYTDRSAALAPEHANLTVPGGNGVFKATVVAGGQVAGTWRKAQGAAEKQREVAGAVLPQLFGELSPAQHKALEKAAKAYAASCATN